jgi:hypothetical protein
MGVASDCSFWILLLASLGMRRLLEEVLGMEAA